MACGTPVVASDVGGLSRLIDDERTGFLVPEGDPETLANRIKWIIASPGVREKIGREAAELAGRFEWSLIAEKVINLYSQLVS